MMLVIRTQVYENYAWNEDGSIGTGDQAYWKPKGGSEYKITNVPLNIDYQHLVSISGVGQDNDYFREHVIDWSLESDEYLSDFEYSQLEYDGHIEYPEPATDYGVLLERVAA